MHFQSNKSQLQLGFHQLRLIFGSCILLYTYFRSHQQLNISYEITDWDPWIDIMIIAKIIASQQTCPVDV